MPPAQQASPAHACPGQQTSPAAPHASHVAPKPPVHASPDAVQNDGAPPEPGQQRSPSPPHVNIPLVHAPAVQVVTVPQRSPACWQVPEMQQPPASQVVPPQHG